MVVDMSFQNAIAPFSATHHDDELPGGTEGCSKQDAAPLTLPKKRPPSP
eukprot:CAMPEP_0174350222 /NCGR_PEP_ID=MMETSP0811_2-20130205/7246_1 /TAXON_ID=73025 ORGANISM="Eutreptiella gymnastica-like, Strain CCMP1594" /NCGR_SAMPLE_ID=MMETSP0811_2 /ASSEMBLY_ACC=CAM_ASM_000667 /LENGTH=48 /DNA_ID= /DNA_START= /DNA_END= /DNA_ORIENTATION=